ncbi:MAG TPA: A/G-specific adenine glycosylase [Phycisphaerae bacterium]|nr:A/G-specific adenine glycosylase [Phycisphaerae bacterium]
MFRRSDATVIRRRLLAWYDRCKRDLPWRRRTGDSYAQLVAEVMLQQTQAATVITYYERFLKRFPTVRALAEAPVDDVLTLWAGLGYYARGRNLHEAARWIVASFGATVPRTVEELMTLPGIGRYTAGAIASVAYDVRAPILDGNVARVLARLLAEIGDLKASVVRDRLWTAAEEILPRKRCGDFNQALMELGATVCVPRLPNCLSCPIRTVCKAYRGGQTDRVPQTGRRTRVLSVRLAVAAVRRADGRMLFIQRPDRGLWGGLWELPSEPLQNDESVEQARDRLARRLGTRCCLGRESTGEVNRQLTHRRVNFHLFQGRWNGNGCCRRLGTQPARWVRLADTGSIGISRACQAVLAIVGR